MISASRSSPASSPAGHDLYEMHEAGVWGLECRLWHGGKRAEPILHAEFTEDANGLAMHFKYIEN